MSFPVIFLDRDGVIIENRPAYVRCWEDVEIFPQAVLALRRAAPLPYRIVVVTNQSVVGRGLVAPETVVAINRRLQTEITTAGGRIDRIYTCPHTPAESCSCRKPAPGLILQAADEMDLDLSRSILVGDALTDLEAARAAGIPVAALVRTGRGAAQEAGVLASGFSEQNVFEDLQAAIERLFP